MLLASTTAPRLLDINLRQPWYNADIIQCSLQHADLVKVNVEELALLARLLRLPVSSERTAATALLDNYGLECVLVTCGADGAWLLQRDGSEIQSRGRRGVHVVDSVGAGDGFAAVFILGRLLGWSAALTLQRANAFSAAICTLRGAIPERAAFYVPFLQQWRLPA
jgi:fructokinase